ncbi:MAG: glycosyltransferase family 9 protein, partial [Longimicrobiales bacterium]
LERGLTVVLTGSAAERELNRTIVERLGREAADPFRRSPLSGSSPRIIDLAGRTDLRTLAAVIERCTVFVASDTGPAHLAAAVGTPLVALFGPKPSHVMGPLGHDARIARLHPPPSTVPDTERGHHHARMWAIEVDHVMAAVERVMERAAGAPSLAASAVEAGEAGEVGEVGEAGGEGEAGETGEAPGGPPDDNIGASAGRHHGLTGRPHQDGATDPPIRP